MISRARTWSERLMLATAIMGPIIVVASSTNAYAFVQYSQGGVPWPIMVAGLAFTYWFAYSIQPALVHERIEIPSEPMRTSVTSWEEGNPYGTMTFSDWPESPEAMTQIAYGVLRGRHSLSVRGLRNCLSDDHARTLLEFMVANGFARWKNLSSHRVGAKLSAKGRAVFNELLRQEAARRPYPTECEPATYAA